MSPELAQWIPPAVIVGVMLYLHRVTRQDLKQLRGSITDLRLHTETQNGILRDEMHTEFAKLRERMDTGMKNLRKHTDIGMVNPRRHTDTGMGNLLDRMGRFEGRVARLEGTLDVLRDFFVRKGRGTAA